MCRITKLPATRSAFAFPGGTHVSTEAQKTLEGIAQELAKEYQTFTQSRREIERNQRLTAQARAQDLQTLQAVYTDRIAKVGDRAKAAKKQLQDAIGLPSTSTDPLNAGEAELTRWELQKDRAARRILPRLEKAATDPHELLSAIKDLAQKAVNTKDQALAAALREEYTWLIPDDAWGLQQVEASAMRRVYAETLDTSLAAFVPQAEQEKQARQNELEKSYQSVAYSLKAAAEMATSQDRELILQNWDGTVSTIEGDAVPAGR